MVVKSYRDLQVWQKAMDLVAESYTLSAKLPKTETFGLASQIQRAAVSIPANIAEGHGREHLGDYLHHLSVANGSLMELETHFLVSQSLGISLGHRSGTRLGKNRRSESHAFWADPEPEAKPPGT